MAFLSLLEQSTNEPDLRLQFYLRLSTCKEKGHSSTDLSVYKMSMSFPPDIPALSEFFEPLLGWLTVFSLITFILSLILIPWGVGRLSEDIFLKLHHNDNSGPPPTISSVILSILRHGLGLVLIFSGIAMIFLPGQGLLTIILGTLLLSFPGKRKLIDSLVCQPKIRKSLNWLRRKRHKPPFQWPKLPGNCDT